jgi:hypothetical protein
LNEAEVNEEEINEAIAETKATFVETRGKATSF